MGPPVAPPGGARAGEEKACCPWVSLTHAVFFASKTSGSVWCRMNFDSLTLLKRRRPLWPWHAACLDGEIAAAFFFRPALHRGKDSSLTAFRCAVWRGVRFWQIIDIPQRSQTLLDDGMSVRSANPGGGGGGVPAPLSVFNTSGGISNVSVPRDASSVR